MPVLCNVIEKVTLLGKNGKHLVIDAKLDSGAWHCSIDEKLLAQLGEYESIDEQPISNANGTVKRPVVDFKFVLKGVTIQSCVTVADRSKMKYKLLIGREALANGEFWIDPSTAGKEAASKLRVLAASIRKASGYCDACDRTSDQCVCEPEHCTC